tara:strand:- start:508 stop:2871 length:2364 start_codon:yes stop_codon:yes gene_type:complete
MAKSKLLKAKKRAKARARKSVERQDYRQGGRVAFQRGGPRNKEELLQQPTPQPAQQPSVNTEAPVMPVQPTTQPVQQSQPVQPAPQPVEMGRVPVEMGKLPIEQEPLVEKESAQTTYTGTTRPGPGGEILWWKRAGYDSLQDATDAGWRVDPETGQWTGPTETDGEEEETAPDVGFTQYLTPEQEKSRQERYARSETDLEKAKAGTLDMPQIDQPAMIEEGPASEIVEMKAPTKVGDTTIYEEGQEVPTETVVTGTTSTAQSPEAIKASTYTADEINEAPVVDSQTGSISPQAIAGMQSQALTKAATGVTIDDDTASKGLTDRVVGVLSDGAMASEQAVKGLNLPKVLRAKKQLRNAGLTEEQITEIGNDPEALEARLMEFTEEERGMIEGLPEEALVSTQMDQLLTGLDNGEVPTWARPAVSAVNQMMASRGLDVSTVGRDALFNAIIQSAMPLAQSNAQAIQQSVSQQRGIEAQAELQNAQMRQQTALTNASNVFNMNMAQFNADQQTALSNSKFLQTVALTNASNEQQAAIQEAASLAQLDLATLDSNTKLAAQNAQSFLAMDMQNLSNRQQGAVLNAQMDQQRLLSNQAAVNAAEKFNATSQMQTDQFMASLKSQTDQFNVTQFNAMEQFNTQQQNAAEARRVQNQVDVDKADAAMKVQIDQFNSQQDFAYNQWNAQNAQVVKQADVKWRRQLNTANTAAINAVNQQNAQNAFNLSSQAQAFMWQELRDQADYAFRSADNYEQRKSAMYIAMLGNESGNYEGGKWEDYMSGAKTLLDGFLTGD